MAKQKSDVEFLSRMVSSELQNDSIKLGQQLFPEIVQSGETMKQPDYLAMVTAQWQDPAYRKGLLNDMGPDNFLALAKDVLDKLGNTSLARPGGPAGLGAGFAGPLGQGPSPGTPSPVPPVPVSPAGPGALPPGGPAGGGVAGPPPAQVLGELANAGILPGGMGGAASPLGMPAPAGAGVAGLPANGAPTPQMIAELQQAGIVKPPGATPLGPGGATL